MKLSSIVISSRVRLARNFEGIPFPIRLTDNELAMSISKAVFEVFVVRIYNYVYRSTAEFRNSYHSYAGSKAVCIGETVTHYNDVSAH